MIKKIIIICTIIMLVVVSATPALAQKPPDSTEKGNPIHVNNGKGTNPDKNNGNPNPANPVTQNSNASTKKSGDAITTSNESGHGFDEFGYNRSARIFNGTAEGWCMEKFSQTEAYCEAYLGVYAHDKLIMKWNAEWDRGNTEDWLNPPYNAWENNQWNGKVPGGSGEVWHYKIVWVGPCGADETPLDNGGYCLWGQFEVLSDHGTADGVHTWLTHAKPNGYGSYP